MTALELLNLITQALFIALAGVAIARALRVRSRTSLDMALLFGSVAATVILSRAATWLGIEGSTAVTGVIIAVLALAPLAMLRLVDDFRGQPRWLTIAGYAGYVLVVLDGFDLVAVAANALEIGLLAFFTIAGGYAAVAFARESRRTRGITRRRMTLVASGATLFIGAIVILIVASLLPDNAVALEILAQVAALGSAIALWLGFIPPAWVRRAMREPDLRRFVDRSIRLAGVADDRSMLTELHSAVADAFGAAGATVGLADPDRSVLRYVARATGDWVEYPDDEFVAGRTFQEGRSLVVPDATAVDPAHADTYRRSEATTVLATPIDGESGRIGVLVVYAGREPIFAEDDIALLELLADQLGVLLDARRLARQVADVRAREETARLKEEFLSSAAHDLRSPLTVVLGQAELLERRVMRRPDEPVDPSGVTRMAREARRLRDLVNDLLDAQRLEQGGLTLSRTREDLGAIVAEIEAQQREEGQAIGVHRPAGSLVGSFDRARMHQVIANLVENARKYGPEDADPRIVLEAADGGARISVVDRGIGIPESERERVFDRFYRATNAQRVTDTGLGLGLYICRRIVEEHGGRIWHEPTPGGGSTFVIVLPLEDIAPADKAGTSEALPTDARPSGVLADAVVRPPFTGELPADA